MFAIQVASASLSPNYLENPYTQSLGVVDTHSSGTLAQNFGPLIADTYNVSKFISVQNNIINFENKHSIEWMGLLPGDESQDYITGLVSASNESNSGSLESNTKYSLEGKGLNLSGSITESAMTVISTLNNEHITGSGTYTWVDNNVITQHTLLYDPDGTVFESPGNCNSYTLNYDSYDDIATYTPCGGSFQIEKE